MGNVYYALSGDTAWTATVNNTSPLATPPLNITGIVRSAINNQVCWFADGVNWALYSALGGQINPSNATYAANSVNTWTPSTTDLLGNPITSVLPIDSDGNLPTLIVNWRNRICLSGLLGDPQTVFMSAVGDPTNFDYSPEFTSTTQAVALNPNSPAGYVGDVVTTMIPYTNDVILFGGDHTLYMLTGDPMSGGLVNLVSTAIGMAYGIPWCMDPYGNIFFVSNRSGIYQWMPGQQPARISQPIEQLIANIDTGLTTITSIWDDRFQGCHFFFTPTQGVTGTAVTDPHVSQEPVTHLFYEARTGAWWQDQFANPNHNPLCNVVFDGNTPDDRVPLIGSWDGYCRAIDPFATDDDGWPIDSQVMLGPFLSADFDDFMLYEIQGILGQESGTVNYEIFAGTTAEEALANGPVSGKGGTFVSGRNATSYIRVAAHALYLQLSASEPWQLEGVRCRVSGSLGKVRRRSAH